MSKSGLLPGLRCSTIAYVLILLAILSLSSLQIEATSEESDILHSLDAVIRLKMSGEVEIVPTQGNYRIDELIIRSFLYPRDSYHQDILGFRTGPKDYSMEDGAIVLRWTDPGAGVLDYHITGEISTDGRRSEIRRKIDFPHDVSALDDDATYYLQSAELIDSDHPEVSAKAEELLDGIDDYYEAVFTLARWVNENIDYNLSTLNEDAERKASWVLDKRRGVCAEMTSLFVAMLRSQGIPARYVSGVSYTDSDLFDFNWGAHGWSDVYFPDHGWVPFDVTYGQYGFIDPSHMKLRSTLDSGEPSSYFQWYGRDIDVRSSMLEFDVEVLEMSERSRDEITIDLMTRSDEVDFGSHNLIIATITNNRNYYLPVTMTMSRTSHLELLDHPRQEILLRPGEERRMYWRLRVDPDLSERMIYTFPVRLSSPSGHSAETSFTSRHGATHFSLENIDAAIRSRLELRTEPYSSNVDFVCSLEREHHYPDDDILVVCEVGNDGDLDLYDLEICMFDSEEDQCEKTNLLSRESETFEFFPENRGIGRRQLGFSLNNEDVAITDELRLDVIGYPSIEVRDVILPSTVDHGTPFNLSFIIDVEHHPEDVNLNLSMNGLTRSWQFDRLSEDREFLISMVSRDLVPGDNHISLEIDYVDKNGKTYHLREEFRTELVNVPLLDRIFIRIRTWLESLIS